MIRKGPPIVLTKSSTDTSGKRELSPAGSFEIKIR